MLANLRTAPTASTAQRPRASTNEPPVLPAWSRVAATTGRRPEPAGIHVARDTLGHWMPRHDDRADDVGGARRAPKLEAFATGRPAAQHTTIDLPHQSMLLLGASRARLEGTIRSFLADDLYAGLRNPRNGREFDREIGRIARRLAPLGLEPAQIRELYDQRVHGDEQRALIIDKVLMALPYQAASVVAAQVALPALAHLPLLARSAAASFATAAFDEAAQGLVRGTMAQRFLPHHRPADRYSPVLHRLLRKHAPHGQDSGLRELGTAVGGVALKNLVRTGLSAGAAAFNVSNAGIGTIGAVFDLTGGTGAVANASIARERKDHRTGLQWLLAFDGAPSVLKAALDAGNAPSTPTSAAQRVASAGRSVGATARQVANAVPGALRAAVGPTMVAKGLALMPVIAAGEMGNEYVEKKYGEHTPLGDTAARKRRGLEGGEPEAVGSGGGEPASQPNAPSAERPESIHDKVKSVAEAQGIAAGLGVFATIATVGPDQLHEKYSKRSTTATPAQGLRRRDVWTTQV